MLGEASPLNLWHAWIAWYPWILKQNYTEHMQTLIRIFVCSKTKFGIMKTDKLEELLKKHAHDEIILVYSIHFVNVQINFYL